jgi:two-component system cell cycle sensor histidine kinase PleC
MVARRSSSDSHDPSNEKAARKTPAEREAEIDAMWAKLDELAADGGGFLSDAVHAIKNPLTVTHSYLEILNTDLSEGLTDEQRSFLGIAYENVVKLRQLIEDLVDLASLETGTAQIDFARHTVTETIGAVSGDLQPAAAEKGVKLTTEHADGLPQITVDQGRLKDVLRRLLENAIRFTPKGGSVALRATSDEKSVTIVVADNGVGIPADRVSDSLKAFVQIHRKPGEHRDSYGLGLPLCRRQVEAFGGTLELESSEGQGTTVTIRIPVTGNSNQ